MLADGALDTLIDVLNGSGGADSTAVLGCNYRDVHAGRLRYPDESASGFSWRERKTVITSGSLVSVGVYDAIGPFRDAFFIDHVDDEYCLRARKMGYRVLSTCKPVMLHSVGASTLHRLLWKKTGVTNHPPFRRYYMTRNHIILMKEYFTRRAEVGVRHRIFENEIPRAHVPVRETEAREGAKRSQEAFSTACFET